MEEDSVDTIVLFADLFGHMHWADALTWRSVLESPSAMSDHTIRERLHHTHLCQWAWLRIWLGQPVDGHAGESLNLTSLALWAREYHDDIARYLARVQQSDLEVQITVPDIDKESRQPFLWQTFLQITGHSTYHRGQVSARLRQIGGDPQGTDFIGWIALGKPKAEWPNEAEPEVKPRG
jgi:uncharacterized damage-inducible protein DinB